MSVELLMDSAAGAPGSGPPVPPAGWEPGAIADDAALAGAPSPPPHAAKASAATTITTGNGKDLVTMPILSICSALYRLSPFAPQAAKASATSGFVTMPSLVFIARHLRCNGIGKPNGV